MPNLSTPSPRTLTNERPTTRHVLSWLLIVIVGTLALSPVIMLFIGSLSQGLTGLGSFTLQKYVVAYTDPRLFGVICNTVVFTIGSSIIATIFGFLLAYLNTRTDIPAKGLFTVLSIVPMMVPHLLFAASWSLLLNPSNGFINIILQKLFGNIDAVLDIYSLTGMTIVQGIVILPVSYLIMAPALSTFDSSLEEASLVSGAHRTRTLLRITVPMLRPAILASLVLGIVQSLAAFSVPTLLGMPRHVSVLATFLWQMISAGIAPDYGKAAALGMSVLAASIGMIFLYRYLTASSEQYATVTGKGYRKPSLIALGEFRWLWSVIMFLLTFFIVILPVLTLLYTSFTPYAMVPSMKAFSSMGLLHWHEIFYDPTSLLALKNSVFLAIVGATVGVILSVFVAYVVVRLKSVSAGILESLSFLSFSFPGIVIGIGFMWFFVRTPLYATVTSLLIAYIATYLPFGVRPLASAFQQISTELEEASAVCGAGLFYTMKHIVAPLLIPGMVSAWILLASMFCRELTVSVVLSKANSTVLSVLILDFANDGSWGQLSALGIVMIIICTFLVLLATFVGRHMRRKYAA